MTENFKLYFLNILNGNNQVDSIKNAGLEDMNVLDFFKICENELQKCIFDLFKNGELYDVLKLCNNIKIDGINILKLIKN